MSGAEKIMEKKIIRQEVIQSAIQELDGISYLEWQLVKREIDVMFNAESRKQLNMALLTISEETMDRIKRFPLSE